jgi:acetylornithine/succinyldiaminopimelate/putrescine aminotransferase
MSNLMRTLAFRDREIVSGDGAYMVDSDGTRLLDFYADTGAASLGYNHPQARKAMQRLLDEDIPVHSLNLVPFKERETAARRVCEKARMDKAFFANSGTEANCAAIKLARLHQTKRFGSERNQIWALEGGFHGRSYGPLAASSGPIYHYEGMGPHAPGYHKWDWDTMETIDPKRAAAVIMSPILGRHDIVVYTREQLQSIRAYCDEHDILLIFDEVQSGGGRCGEYLYAHQMGVMPDIATLAKGVALGYPTGICLARGECADTFSPGNHFSTFGGAPAACVFVGAMLDYLTRDFLDGVKYRGGKIREAMSDLGWFEDVVGAGLLSCGFAPHIDAMEFAKRCDAKGLIVGAWRPSPIRVTPVLDISLEVAYVGLDIMDSVYKDMTR